MTEPMEADGSRPISGAGLSWSLSSGQEEEEGWVEVLQDCSTYSTLDFTDVCHSDMHK